LRLDEVVRQRLGLYRRLDDGPVARDRCASAASKVICGGAIGSSDFDSGR